MEYRWQLPDGSDRTRRQYLMDVLGISPVLAELLLQRGITNFQQAKDFFRPSLKELHDPFRMKDMDRAVARIDRAVRENQTILVYGDYDVDGTTAVAGVYSFLSRHHSKLHYYIPDRYKEGYGISLQGIDYASEQGASLIIALDCGIKALRQVEYAREKGIDFIICDHHLPGEKLPEAYAVLDPKRKDCSYPYDELSGCGVGLKLVQALCKTWNLPDGEWQELLDLLTVSIGSDIVPITGENRILAFHGLAKLNKNPRKGLQKLQELSNKKGAYLDIQAVVFQLGPRINAAGRIAHGKLAVQLLTSTDNMEIVEVAEVINDHNTNRRQLDSGITVEALEQIEEKQQQERFTTVVHHKGWHKGVIGIVASRLIETYYRPTVVFAENNGKLTGSARSVPGFNLYEALCECSEHIEQFGGHSHAAGMTLDIDKLEAFRERFEQVAAAKILPEQRVPALDISAELPFEEITGKFYRILRQFAPFGPGNQDPLFVSHHLQDTGKSRIVGADGSHLKLELHSPEGTVMEGIAFGLAEKLELLQSGKPVSAVYHLDINEYQGKTSLQLRVKDLKSTAEVAASRPD